MRRGGAPALPIEPAQVPAHARVERGPRGLRLGAAQAPARAADAPTGSLRLRAAAPVAVRRAAVVAGGRLVLALGSGVAYSLAAPEMRVIHDRRPPGVDALEGAHAANAGLLRADGGWRAVVLPSLGDMVADLGPGPVAIRADGRRVAAAADGGVQELDAGAEGPAARHEGPAGALAYGHDGALWAAAGARVGPPGTAPGDGPPIVALAAAAAAPRLAALHDDGSVSVWEAGAGEPLAAWPAPVEGAGSIALTPDGELVALGAPDARDPVACLARAADGAVARSVAGARVIAPSPDRGGLAVGGDWGCAWLDDDKEDG